jgi:hypothetical protein
MERLRQQIRQLMLPKMEDYIDLNCDVIKLAEQGPMPIEEWSENEVREVHAWAVSGFLGPEPKPVVTYLDKLASAGLLKTKYVRGYVSSNEWRGEHVTFKCDPRLETFVDDEGRVTHWLPGMGRFPGRMD